MFKVLKAYLVAQTLLAYQTGASMRADELRARLREARERQQHELLHGFMEQWSELAARFVGEHAPKAPECAGETSCGT
jgi:hypothetical protein